MRFTRPGRWWRARTIARIPLACDASSRLATCRAGCRATVLGVTCAGADARRLRILGVYEGALVSVVGRRSGVLLDVCGTRLALSHAVAATIIVRPASA